MGIIMID